VIRRILSILFILASFFAQVQSQEVLHKNNLMRYSDWKNIHFGIRGTDSVFVYYPAGDSAFLYRDSVVIRGGGGGAITLTGNVTGSGTGSIATTIAAGVVTLANMQNRATQTFIGRNTAGAGAPEELSVATAKTMLGLTGTNSGDQTITLTGDVSGSGTGSFATTIGSNVVTNAKAAQMGANTIKGNNTAATANAADIALGVDEVLRRSGSGNISGGTLVTNNIGANQVTNSRLAQMATNTIKGNNTAGTADPIDLTAAQTKTLLAITESDVASLTTDLAAKAPLASPTFTGTPAAPTPSFGTNTTQVATTAFVLGQGPVYARVTGSNATTTGQTLTNITGLSVALTTNAVYEFEANLTVSTSAVTTGTQYGVQYSAAGAAVEALCDGSLTTTSNQTVRISALNTATVAYLTSSAQSGGILIKGVVTTGANAGNLTIQHLKVTSGTSTVFINSFLKVTRIQ
jgi:hypothetical protein